MVKHPWIVNIYQTGKPLQACPKPIFLYSLFQASMLSCYSALLLCQRYKNERLGCDCGSASEPAARVVTELNQRLCKISEPAGQDSDVMFWCRVWPKTKRPNKKLMSNKNSNRNAYNLRRQRGPRAPYPIYVCHFMLLFRKHQLTATQSCCVTSACTTLACYLTLGWH